MIYTIKGGNHYSGLHMGLVRSNELKFVVQFNKTAKYTSINEENQFDINKLYGFSDNNSFHHNNSARFGWRWVNEELQLFAYCYSNGERHYDFITNLDLGKFYALKIEITDDAYEFSVSNNKLVSIERSSNTSWGIKYKLYPYFGGDETSPQDIEISIEDT